MNICLKGQTALVTGGATGIGAETCRVFAESGAAVCVNYYPSERDRSAAEELISEIRASGGIIEGFEADVADPQAVSEMVASIEARFGGVDMLVNNAMVGIASSFLDLDFEDYLRLIRVNSGGAFLVSKACMPHMLKSGFGSIIMISSSAFINGGGGSVAYPSSKGAMEGLMTGLVHEYAKHNIRINTVRPAVVDTVNNHSRYTDEEWANYIGKMPMRRAGSIRDNANAIVFLSDKDSAGFINGTSLDVDGARVHHLRP
ncbi:MAG: SDR family oxidoreductase [Oscillospiraceae bacterium]